MHSLLLGEASFSNELGYVGFHFFVRSAEKLSSSNVSFTSILKQTVEQIQAFLLNIAIYIAIQVASGLIYALAGIVKDDIIS